MVGYSPEPARGYAGINVSAITELADTPISAVRGADLIVLAVPPRATLDLIVQIASALEQEAILSDVCIVQGSSGATGGRGRTGNFGLPGGHPLAGTHQSGFLSARPDRLRGCVVYICESGTAGGHRASASVASFWQHTMEASPVLISAENHDRQLAWTGHLPQAVAYALARSLAEYGLAGVSYGSGARDTTRLAAGNPDMWVDILLYNQPAVSEALARTETHLAELRRLLAAGDGSGLRSYLAAAQVFRKGIER